mmetsp:Transcript_114305/g.198746  ORF Transcript_114305/g.198746 Transcript_114305/m.198746 type:complete len:300 (+) Transcript_114305:483-1382(+)
MRSCRTLMFPLSFNCSCWASFRSRTDSRDSSAYFDWDCCTSASSCRLQSANRSRRPCSLQASSRHLTASALAAAAAASFSWSSRCVHRCCCSAICRASVWWAWRVRVSLRSRSASKALSWRARASCCVSAAFSSLSRVSIPVVSSCCRCSSATRTLWASFSCCCPSSRSVRSRVAQALRSRFRSSTWPFWAVAPARAVCSARTSASLWDTNACSCAADCWRAFRSACRSWLSCRVCSCPWLHSWACALACSRAWVRARSSSSKALHCSADAASCRSSSAVVMQRDCMSLRSPALEVSLA